MDELFGKLDALADKLGLPPAQGHPAASGTTPPPAGGGGQKTPTAAPSADALRLALDALPNQPGGPFDDRAEWVKVAHAVKGASFTGGIEAEGREAFVAWSAQWGGDLDEPGRVWDGITKPGAGWGWIMRQLRSVNPAGATAVESAIARAAFQGAAATNVAALSANAIRPVQPLVASRIPPRPWVYGRVYLRGVYSLLVASGGSGKSALTMVEALAIATGRELIPGQRVVGGPKTVWYHNGEDSEDEQQRRLVAAMDHHGIRHGDLGGRLILTSGHDHPIKLGGMGQNGPELTPGTGQWVVDMVRDLGVDVLILDPLGAVHGLPENSNEAMNLLAGGLTRIATTANIAIGLIHHVSQAAAGNMQASGANAARGATALVDRSRNTRQISRPDEREAAALGIQSSERWRYLAVKNGKANNARLGDAHWVKLVSVPLHNGTAEYPAGDEVQTVEHWTPPTGTIGAPGDLTRLQDAIRARAEPPLYAPQSSDWVGYMLAEVMGLDAGLGLTQARCTAEQTDARARIKATLGAWVASGGLKIERRPNPKLKRDATAAYVLPGLPAMLSDADCQTPDAVDAS